MGLLEKVKKKEEQGSDVIAENGSQAEEEKVIRQDLEKAAQPGMVFIIHLLMKDRCSMPQKDVMTSVMRKHLGEVQCFTHDDKLIGFAAKKYNVEFKDCSMPPQLMVMECIGTEDYHLDEITKSQMWDCPESEEILDQCKYQVIATDMMAAGMDYKERAEMLMDFVEALVELYPECVAVQFQSSGKMFTRDRIINHDIPRDARFIYFAVNVRFFRIQGTDDFIVDTLGMNTLFMPDLQYHFHDMDPNWVVNHAYNLCSYMFDNDNPIKSGETVDGITDGEMDRNIKWKCHYENSLVQPAREVLDVCMNQYSSGQRNY